MTTFDPNNYVDMMFYPDGQTELEKVYDYDDLLKELDEEIEAMKKKMTRSDYPYIQEVTKALQEAQKVRGLLIAIDKEDIIYEE
jgi:hypothetical protein